MKIIIKQKNIIKGLENLTPGVYQKDDDCNYYFLVSDKPKWNGEMGWENCCVVGKNGKIYGSPVDPAGDWKDNNFIKVSNEFEIVIK